MQTLNADGTSSVVLVCEHATHDIPEVMNHLGLSPEARISHAAWDPGAMAVATRLSSILDAKLVASRVSRLVYDCNRPPEAADAMPVRSEIYDVPGNQDLTPAERAARTEAYYIPFRDTLAQTIVQTDQPVIVTIHSFTPVFLGQVRETEIGVLHDADARVADAMLQVAPAHTDLRVEANKPYGPEDGVTHTLKVHALPFGHQNVMLEIRNDLIGTQAQQDNMARMIAAWLVAALAQVDAKGAKPSLV